ncbi:glycerate kinase [Stackebrandtia nassauensis]|uniref:Glycerate kinase n=1 Tax=Stackebrandtia nassauensis (strain DSM 44728 / CIP 108903 / NRRL B-16338 / NBRC 102104 / LLR-40K-21) TaxID=446470 RepID=D3Q148_STANL|nr:glycerate kinase [Stackebrandtia nassauensis]ADD43798.1 glycerate kinase [Stackebrandtia nassauensis DSM 44728]
MRVLICPDKFAGTLSAPEAAAAVAEGWHEVNPDDQLDVLPLSDGGPGMLDALAAALDGRRESFDIVDPLGRKVSGDILLVGDTAYIESAEACGLHLLDPEERDPLRATSFGLGQLMTAAVEAGARTLVIGLGGSATNDAGAGMLTALGLTPLDSLNRALPYGGGVLADCVTLDGAARLRGATIVAATDVDNPLCGINGASAIFGPQKGASDNDVQILDHALSTFGHVLSGIPGSPPNVADLPGAGAAGGLGAALFALGGSRASGADLIGRAVGLREALDSCDLVITGEGSFDHQSLRGKLVSGIAEAATERGLPCVVVAGRVTVGRREALTAGITRTMSLTEHFGSSEEAMAKPAEGLTALGAKLAQKWRPR